MSFVSYVFLIFYPVVLTLYYLLSGRLRLQNLLLLAASLFFYGWWDWRFLGLLLFTSGIDFMAGWIMEDYPRWRRTVLTASLGTNLITLFFFKYFDFFAVQLSALLLGLGGSGEIGALGLILPLGISFYTFQSMAYTIDVYRGDTRAERDPFLFLGFITFFPQLVAGPIERANDLLPQFKRPRTLRPEAVQQGIWLIVWGYSLKLVIGDSAGLIVDNAFRPDQYYGWSTILGTLAFGIQVFGDFCGYSYIAKGLAALMGFELVWNFRQPYWSLTIRDFWRRWHVSLSNWLRDYLYIPLGGNQRGRWRGYLNLVITMTLAGIWHGAGWNFVFWGMLQGVALAGYHWYDSVMPKHRRLPAPVAWFLTMLVVFSGFFLFRGGSWETISGMAAALGNMTWTPGHTLALRALIVASIPIIVVEGLQQGLKNPFVIADAHWSVRAAFNGLALLLMVSLIDRARTEFVYFQF